MVGTGHGGCVACVHCKCIAFCPLFGRVFQTLLSMKIINGIDAIRMAQDVSNIKGGGFHVWFYAYNRSKGAASTTLKELKDCTTRPQLPPGKFDIDSDNYFLFNDANGDPKTCYRILWRYIAFPPQYQMCKINWL